jgi:predicted house-cleaning noncanonical NTP pyrophosphatase (MazG superfamily)
MKYKHTHTNLKIENEYPKLVRDKIPEIVEKRTGRKTRTKIMKSRKEYENFLKAKVIEEANELSKTKDKIHLVEEMSDILEIFDSLIELNKLTFGKIRKIQKQKAKERGGFKKRILMLEKND